MYSEAALYEFAEEAISDSGSSDALYDAQSYQSLKGNVEGYEKIIRLECYQGEYYPNANEKEEEFEIKFTVEFLVLPEDDELQSLINAKDLSFEMYKQFVRAMGGDLGGRVCSYTRDGFDIGETNLAGNRYAATYLYGVIN